MANKVTLDFETGMITWDTEHQKGIEVDLDLAKKETAILAAMGYSKMDFSKEIAAFNAFINGDITEKELLNRVEVRSEKDLTEEEEIFIGWLNQIERKLGEVDASPKTMEVYEQVVLMVKQLRWAIRDGEHLPGE